jgi:hypothetical protein
VLMPPPLVGARGSLAAGAKGTCLVLLVLTSPLWWVVLHRCCCVGSQLHMRAQCMTFTVDADTQAAGRCTHHVLWVYHKDWPQHQQCNTRHVSLLCGGKQVGMHLLGCMLLPEGRGRSLQQHHVSSRMGA